MSNGADIVMIRQGCINQVFLKDGIATLEKERYQDDGNYGRSNGYIEAVLLRSKVRGGTERCRGTFGMRLRHSSFKQKSNFDQAISIAKAAKGKDDDGYRSEFVRLAESAKSLAGNEQLISKE